MKKMLFGTIILMFVSSLAWAAPDYKGYNKYIKDNAEKMKTLEHACNVSNKATKEGHKKCNEFMMFRVQAECRYEINPNACKALDEIEKTGKKK